jgi:hypothetical protein
LRLSTTHQSLTVLCPLPPLPLPLFDTPQVVLDHHCLTNDEHYCVRRQGSSPVTQCTTHPNMSLACLGASYHFSTQQMLSSVVTSLAGCPPLMNSAHTHTHTHTHMQVMASLLTDGWLISTTPLATMRATSGAGGQKGEREQRSTTSVACFWFLHLHCNCHSD